jgi:CheY-like chemotaxis protein
MQKKRILVVDDEVSVASVVRKLIEKTGMYEARSETDGSNAYLTAKEYKPALMLLDIMMPNMEGGEVANQMRDDPETRDIPIVFISGAITKEEAKERGTIMGGYPVLAKPLRMQELSDIIEEQIGGGSGTGEKAGDTGSDEAPDFKERRKYPRIDTSGLLSYICLDENDNTLNEGIGDAVNISKGGIRLKTHTKIESKFIQLTANSVKNELIDIKGKVVYSYMLKPDTYHTGISFVESMARNQRFVVELIKSYNMQKISYKGDRKFRY